MSLHPLKTKFTIFHSPGQIISWDDINLVIDENDPECTNYDPNLMKKLEYVNTLKYLLLNFLEYTLIQHYHLNIILIN